MDLRRSMTYLVASALVVTGCGEVDTGPTGPSGSAALGSADHGLSLTAAPAAAGARNFVAPLDSDQEVPSVDSRARGMAHFQLSLDGDELSYRLNVANIQDVLMAHIHLAPRGENGGIVVWLYPSSPPPELIPGRSNGTLATGTVAADDLVGDLGGEELSALLDAMEAGDTYVNVHTTANPAGEIRGQIQVAGPR
ncbi:MAG: CHRD domain-containing protein [Longimicrobiales bacterium]